MNRPCTPLVAIGLGALGGFTVAVGLAMVAAVLFGTKPRNRRH
jgi:hypothetical protein